MSDRFFYAVKPKSSAGVSWLPFVILLLATLGRPVIVAAERVARVIDGDTILLEGGRKVRYAGINAPEQGDPGFRESMQANNLIVGGKDVRLEFGRKRTEKHDRLLAYVYVGRTFVQAELAKQGWAIVTRTQSIPRYREMLKHYQEEAKPDASPGLSWRRRGRGLGRGLKASPSCRVAGTDQEWADVPSCRQHQARPWQKRHPFVILPAG